MYEGNSEELYGDDLRMCLGKMQAIQSFDFDGFSLRGAAVANKIYKQHEENNSIIHEIKNPLDVPCTSWHCPFVDISITRCSYVGLFDVALSIYML